MHSYRSVLISVLFLAALTGCTRHKQARVSVPPPPAAQPGSQPENNPNNQPSPKAESVPSGHEPAGDANLSIPANAAVLSTEVGKASWYGAPYHNRRTSSGEIYNMNAMTAAHRTFPLGSIVRVTNVKTGHTALVRITDRGPFVKGRVLDVSYAAAKRLDIWQPGIASVKIELMQTPTSLTKGGRWAVQIGSFGSEKQASSLVDHLTRRYRSATVTKFLSPVGVWWVRVRVSNDERQRAETLAQETETGNASVYVVRLD